MVAVADVGQIRVLPVSAAGAARGWTLLDQAIRDLSPSGFIAIDTEFSGLGTDPRLNDADISVRYEAWRTLAESRAILSLGISLFNPIELTDASEIARAEKVQPQVYEPARKVAGCDATRMANSGNASESATFTSSDFANEPEKCALGGGNPEGAALAKKCTAYSVTTLEFLLRCNSPFEIVADAGAFLVAHGFDFNDMFSNGIAYIRASSEKVGKNEDAESAFRWGPYPRGLLWRMGRAAVPIVLHNGFMDLVLMYTSFHGPLPKTLNGFISKLLDSVPAGFWDTKLLATGPGGERVSFLGYLYARAVTEDRIRVSNRQNLPPDQTTRPPKQIPLVKKELCALYAVRGYCKNGIICPNVHDPFMVVEGRLKGTLPTDLSAAQKLYKKQSKKAKAKLKGGEGKKTPKLNKKARARLVAAELAEKAKLEEKTTRNEIVVDAEEPSSAGEAEVKGNSETVGKRSESGAILGKRLRRGLDQDILKKGQPQKSSERLGNNVNSVADDCDDARAETKNSLSSNTTNRQSWNERSHSAGWDAFCTGFVFANYRLRLSKDKLKGLHNRINLVKKSSPLFLCRSLFAGPSEAAKNEKEKLVEGNKAKELELH